MKKLVFLLALFTVLPASAANAQEVVPDPVVLDSVKQSYQDAMIVVRDTLLAVQTLASRASRDLNGTAYDVVVSRIGRLRRACDAAALVAEEKAEVFNRRGAEPHLEDLVESVSAALGDLVVEINRNCISVFTPELAQAQDSLTQWGPYHIRQASRLGQEYVAAAYALAQAAEFRIPPRFR